VRVGLLENRDTSRPAYVGALACASANRKFKGAANPLSSVPGRPKAVNRRGGPPITFRISRDLPVGRHPLLAAFPGLDRLETAKRLEPDPKVREALFDETCVEVVADDIWMYVAPWDIPQNRRGRWKPVLSPGSDCIVIGREHLSDSPELVLFLDIFHELCHIRQRHAGAELFDDKFSYVRRPTEVEAYRFVVEEGHRLGVEDGVLREYLKVEWISEAELLELLTAVGVPSAH
jgi:hypothetical protein